MHYRDIRPALDARTDDTVIIWAEHPDDRVIPGSKWAYITFDCAIGRIGPEGDWQWFGHDDHDDAREKGKCASMEDAHALITARWRRCVARAEQVTLMTDAQKLAAYKRMLLGRISSGERRQAISALKTMEKCGWLQDCPVLLNEFAAHLPATMQLKLQRLGKIEQDAA